MNKTEKKFKEYMEENIHVKDTYNDIAKKISFNEEEEKTFMKNKKVIGPVLCCVGALAVVGVVGITTKGFGLFKEKEAKSMVTIDTNPSIELVVDEKDKVVSVRGANDDGKLVLYGEKVVGKDVEKAVEIIIQAEIDTGYIVANAQIGANQFSLTVSSDTTVESSELVNTIQNKVKEVCENNNIAISLEESKALARTELEKLALELDPTLTEEQVKEMETSQLLAVIKLYQLETVELYNAELEALYTNVKEFKFDYMSQESTIEAMKTVDGAIADLAVSAYETSMNLLKTAQDAVETTRYNLLVKEDSIYQQQVAALKDKKQEVLALKNEVAKLEDGTEKTNKEAALTIALNNLENAEVLLEQAYVNANATLDTVVATLDSAMSSLDSALESFLTAYSSISNTVKEKLTEAETKLNETKDQIFADFEEKYSDEIAHYEEEIASRKEAMKEAIAG
ncbi:MAG: hypothetical protein ACI311_02145 [Bacilli bacterium]